MNDSSEFTVLWENEFVRVLSYAAEPGAQSEPREHPNSVVVALTDVQHWAGGVALAAGEAAWLPAHVGAVQNVGDGSARAIVVELKGAAAGAGAPAAAIESRFGLSDARLREIFGAEIVDAGVVLSAEDPEATRWDAEVSYASQMERHKGWSAYATVGVNVVTGQWSFSCDTDAGGACVHTYGLVKAAIEDRAFAALAEEGAAAVG
ncbi:hypothetical protein HQQ80_11520 [Microbacteriaceae bacterium VKM Ac-2855]|nr:hypothetical protein [Microbacteriaceae bacterium VKM Ac-2855]